MEDADDRSLVKNEVAEYGSTHQPPLDEEGKELNEIYEDIGLGAAQYLYWTLVALVAYSDYAELTLLAVILPSLRCEWGLSANFEAAITITTYGSYAVFAVLFGTVADRYGRKTAIQWSVILLMVAAIAGATSPNKWIFLATRFVTGACVGINLCCIICYGTEFAENKYRSVGVVLFVLAANLGVVAVSAEAFFLLKQLGWRWLIIIVGLPAVPALILILVLPESPRYLCVSGQQDEAMQAVRYMAKLNGKTIKENVRMVCFQDEELGSYAQILSKEHRKSTVALSVMYFNNIFFEFGFIVLLPLLFSSHFCGTAVTPTHKCEPLSQQDLFEITLVGTCGCTASLVAFALAELIGRLLPLRVASFLLLIAVAALFKCVNHLYIVVVVTIIKFLESYVNTTIWIIIPESFPTNIRSTATGFINGWGKFGGVLGTGCVYLLFYKSPYSVIGLFSFSSLIVLITSIVFDRETKDVVLQET